MRSGGTGEPPQGEVRKYKAAPVSEGERGCDCGGFEAFSDDLIDFQTKGRCYFIWRYWS